MLEQRRLMQTWNEGARALGFRRPGEAWAPVDRVRARKAFLSCVEIDPAMADAWLGLHAVGHEPEVALDRMSQNLHQFGEQRRASGRQLNSRFEVGRYSRFVLSDWEDLDMAQAARWLGRGRLDVAWGYLNRGPGGKEQHTLLAGHLYFAAGDYESMLPLMQSLARHRTFGPEAQLLTGIALARRELFGEAERVLADAAERSDRPELAMEATYYRGVTLRHLRRSETARRCLEWVYRHDPRYRQVAELLANPSLAGMETEPLAAPTGRGPKEELGDLLAELDAQIGLDEVKHQVRAVVAQVHARGLRAERGLPVGKSSNHLVFAGPPGTGKTTVARLVGRIYAALGVLRGTAFVEASRGDLVGEYVGQTAPRTGALIDRALDGVLFIDEAYSLGQPSGERADPYGREAIETLMKRMEDDRHRLVVIIAGYPERLQGFLASNPGLRSRFGTTIQFATYSATELLAVAQRFAEEAGDTWGVGALDRIGEAITEASACDWIDELGNGRFVRNLFEAACRHRDLRIFDLTTQGGEAVRDQQLSTVEAVDTSAATNQVLGPLRRRQVEQLEADLRSFTGNDQR